MNNNFQNILAINASAGSGKTYQLTLRYLSLLFLGAHPSKILAVTFTKKAAKEMRERIVQTLLRLSSGEITKGDNLFDSIAKVYDKDIQRKATKLLEQFLGSNNKISTIDSFVHQILRKFCFYAGVRHDFDLFELDGDELRGKFLDFLIKREKFIEYMRSKNESVDKILGFFALLYEEESDIKKLKSELATYDRGEFFAASSELLKCAQLFYEYLHSEKPAKFPERAFTSVNEFLKTNSFEKTLTERENLTAHRDYKALSNEHSERLFANVKAALREYYKASAKDTIAFLLEEFAVYKNARESINKEHNALGYDDVAKYVKELLEDGKIDSDFLYFRLDGEIEHILIDEFQDTSILQFRIIRPLLDEILSGVGTGEFKSFFMVGDPKQSIYRFRGAAAGMFENATNYIAKKAEGRFEEIYLDTNYRSAKTPVAFVNELFDAPYLGAFKTQKSASETDGFVEVALADFDGDDAKEKFLKSLSDKLKALLELGVPSSSVTVLAYTNDDIEEIADALETKGIKTQKESSKSLLSDEGVSALMWLVKYLVLKSGGKSGKLAKLNFMSVVKCTDEDFDSFIASVSGEHLPSRIVFAAVDFFAISSPNTAKLIEIAAGYDDLHAFATQKKVQSEKKITTKNEGVTLMTVHKSKGLEFDCVFLCDTLKTKDSSRMRRILPVHENFALKKLVVTGNSARLLLKDVDEAMKEEEALEQRDLLNANYVAMTRAKHGMCVLKKSSGFSKFDALPLAPKEAENKVVAKSEEGREEFVGYKGTALDANVGRQKDYLKENDFAPNDIKAITRGLALHACFEGSEGLGQISELAKEQVRNKYAAYLGDALPSVFDLANSFDGTEILTGLASPQLYKEISICEKDGDELRLNRIDLLVISDSKAIVIDFKSSHEQKESYKRQLANYRRLVSNALGIETKAYLVLDNGKGKLEAQSI